MAASVSTLVESAGQASWAFMASRVIATAAVRVSLFLANFTIDLPSGSQKSKSGARKLSLRERQINHLEVWQ